MAQVDVISDDRTLSPVARLWYGNSEEESSSSDNSTETRKIPFLPQPNCKALHEDSCSARRKELFLSTPKSFALKPSFSLDPKASSCRQESDLQELPQTAATSETASSQKTPAQETHPPQEVIAGEDPAFVDLMSQGWDFFKQFDRLDLISFKASYDDAKWAQKEVDRLTQKWLECRKLEREKEISSRRWGMTQQVFTWLGSVAAILTGVGLIISGVGAVAGALIVVGGAISLTSQILKTTGVWDKITNLIPSDDPEKRAAISSWIQIGILVFSLILAGSAFVFSGAALFSQTGTIGYELALGTAVPAAQGIVSIAKGLVDSDYYNALADAKTYDARRSEKRHLKEEAVERMNTILERKEGFNEFRKLYMDLLENLNDAFQSGLK